MYDSSHLRDVHPLFGARSILDRLGDACFKRQIASLEQIAPILDQSIKIFTATLSICPRYASVVVGVCPSLLIYSKLVILVLANSIYAVTAAIYLFIYLFIEIDEIKSFNYNV